MSVPPAVTSDRLAFRAAGFMATSTLGMVAGRQDVVVGDVDLEGRDPRQGARRGPDLGREVRQRGQVVAEQRRGVGEAVTGELHPVAGVTGEADDRPIQVDDRRAHEKRYQPYQSLRRSDRGQSTVADPDRSGYRQVMRSSKRVQPAVTCGWRPGGWLSHGGVWRRRGPRRAGLPGLQGGVPAQLTSRCPAAVCTAWPTAARP